MTPTHNSNTRMIRVSRRRRSAGMAMALVLFAVGVAVVLGFTFVTSSASATRAVATMSDYSRARYIAESGLTQTVAYINNSGTWRSDRVEGDWIVDQAFGGGAFTVNVVDGIDEDGDGVVDGDGSIGDSGRDPVTITVTATYGDASFILTGAWSPAAGSTVAAIEKIELKDNALIDSYNSGAGIYSASNQGSAAVISVNDIGTFNIKLKDSSVINGEFLLPEYADWGAAFEDGLTAAETHVTGGIDGIADGVDFPIIEDPQEDLVGSDESIGSDQTINGDELFKKLTITKTLTIEGDVTIVCDTLAITGNDARVELDATVEGHDTTGGSEQKEVQEIQIATKVSVSNPTTLYALGGWVGKKDKDVRFALYTNVSGAPGTLIVQSEVVQPTSDSLVRTVAPVTTPTALAAGDYFVAVCFDDKDLKYSYKSTGGSNTYCRNNDAVTNGFLATWGTSDATLGRWASLFLVGEEDGTSSSLTLLVRSAGEIKDKAIVNSYGFPVDRIKIQFIGTELKFGGDSVVNATVETNETDNVKEGKLTVRENAEFNGKAYVANLKTETNAVLNIDASGGSADPGFVVDNKIEIKNNTVINAVDGTVAIVCNSVGTAVIKLEKNATLKGDAYGGPGGAGGNSEVKVGSNATITGERGNLTEAVDISLPVTPDSYLSIGDMKISSATYTLNTNTECKKLEIKENGILEVVGQVELVVTEDLIFDKNAKITLTAGSTLTMYTKKDVKIEHPVEFNVGGDPASFVWYFNKDKIEIKNTAQIAATIVGPTTEFKLKENAHWYGSVLAKKIKIEQNGQLHYDAGSDASVRWLTHP